MTDKIAEHAIGGFLELELPKRRNSYHHDTIALATGRACLSLIIKKVKPRKIYVPYYTCDSLIKPIVENDIHYEYYKINSSLEPLHEIELGFDEYFVYINYFGIKQETVVSLARKYQNNLIVDNTQAFFEKGYTGCWSFNSARKFFGVPDGAYLYSPYKITNHVKRYNKPRYGHLLNRLAGRLDIAYKQYRKNEEHLNGAIKSVSLLSRKLLETVNYKSVAEIRRRNFNYIHHKLGKFNRLELTSMGSQVPLCYPLLPARFIDKQMLYREKIFIPVYWKKSNLNNKFVFENTLSEKLLPLPIDQRYQPKELGRMVEILIGLLKGGK